MHVDCFDCAPLLTRTYVVILGGRGVMRITERFPGRGMSSAAPRVSRRAVIGRSVTPRERCDETSDSAQVGRRLGAGNLLRLGNTTITLPATTVGLSAALSGTG